MEGMNTAALIADGKAILGIELGSTRIKAVLIDDAYNPIASGSHDWENRLENGIWTYSMDDIVKGVQRCYADLKREVLWGGNLWTSGYYANSVGLYASKDTIMRYIQNQGKGGDEYRKLYESQPELDFGG